MNIYHFDNNGYYIRTGVAKVDPLDTDNYLIPRNATTDPVPDAEQYRIRRYIDKAWIKEFDFRGVPYYMPPSREPLYMTSIGPLPEGATLNRPEEIRLDVLQDRLAEIDSLVKEKSTDLCTTFTCGDHTYYSDSINIPGIVIAMEYLEADHQETWKTAEKMSDGISNVYVTLDKNGLRDLYLSYLGFRKEQWSWGEAHKVALKAIYLDPTKTVEDIKNYNIGE